MYVQYMRVYCIITTRSVFFEMDIPFLHYTSIRKVHLITKYSLFNPYCVLSVPSAHLKSFIVTNASEKQQKWSAVSLLLSSLSAVFVFSIHTHTRWRESPQTHPSG